MFPHQSPEPEAKPTGIPGSFHFCSVRLRPGRAARSQDSSRRSLGCRRVARVRRPCCLSSPLQMCSLGFSILSASRKRPGWTASALAPHFPLDSGRCRQRWGGREGRGAADLLSRLLWVCSPRPQLLPEPPHSAAFSGLASTLLTSVSPAQGPVFSFLHLSEWFHHCCLPVTLARIVVNRAYISMDRQTTNSHKEN